MFADFAGPIESDMARETPAAESGGYVVLICNDALQRGACANVVCEKRVPTLSATKKPARETNSMRV